MASSCSSGPSVTPDAVGLATQSTITSAKTTVARMPLIATPPLQAAPEIQGVGKTMPEGPRGGKTIRTEDDIHVKTGPDDDRMTHYPQNMGKAEWKIEGGKDGEKQICTYGDDIHSAVTPRTSTTIASPGQRNARKKKGDKGLTGTTCTYWEIKGTGGVEVRFFCKEPELKDTHKRFSLCILNMF